jgi:hypothetical protein
MDWIDSPSRISTIYPWFKVVGVVQSCQGVHQDWSMWNIQLGAHSKRWWMEDNIQNSLQSFWICCDAI